MKRALAGLLFVAACSDAPGGLNGPDASVEALRQIARGDGAACTNSATVLTLSDILFPLTQPPPRWSEEQFNDFKSSLRSGVDRVTVKSIDRETKRISCLGDFYASWGEDVWSVPIEYELATEVGDQGIIVSVDDATGARQAFYNAADDYYKARVEAAVIADMEAEALTNQYIDGADMCERWQSPPHTLPEVQLSQKWLEMVAEDSSPERQAIRACVRKIANSPVTDSSLNFQTLTPQPASEYPIGPAPAQ